jgi:hypothetical protein
VVLLVFGHHQVTAHRLRPLEDRCSGRYVGWREQHNEQVHDLYSARITRVIKSRKMKWAGHVARMGVRRGAYRVLVGISDAKRPFGRLRRRLEIISKCIFEK